MISEYLSLWAAVLAFPSIGVIGFTLLTESWSHSNIREKMPKWLFQLVNKMALESSKWNTREFYLRIGGFFGVLLATILQITAVIIKIWVEY